VRGFLRKAKDMLRFLGEIHITHKSSHPYSCWNIKNLGEISGLKFLEEVDFYQFSYPGYNNKRGAGCNCDQSFPIGKCSTFKFYNDSLYP
jgi:25S rRNA (uracil2634-N3)-methyltransferase